MTGCPVVIAGGGPTGLMLAAELALGGVEACVVERRPSQDVTGMRARGLHARTIEVFDQRGIAERFLSEGKLHGMVMGFPQMPVDVSDLASRYPCFLGLRQQAVERILAGWAEDELGVRVQRGAEVAGFRQDEDGVEVELSDGESVRANYLVGCDGGRSLVRRAAGIEFAGWDATKSWLIAEAQMTEEPVWGFREDAAGTHATGRLEDGRGVGLALTERRLRAGEPSLEDVKEALRGVYGSDFGIHSPVSVGRFTDVTRQAACYRDGRVLLAGDAAHVHPPMGGQGLNLGVQDAVNLGWKLALVVKGTCGERLLDTYHAERHPVAARVLRMSMAHVALQRPDERTKALRATLGELLKLEEARKKVGAESAGLDVRYDLGEGHALLGRRMPDLELRVRDGSTRVFALLHAGRPVLLGLRETAGERDVTGWADRVERVEARFEGRLEVPVIGEVSVPAAVLIRPDGYVAWVGEESSAGLEEALRRWFGEPVSGE